ncbi:MAG: putative lipid flippase MurJ [Dehalococcoidia bacterium]|nr:putative lipid flippase MurJ [Dehalococcoidia bacterium]
MDISLPKAALIIAAGNVSSRVLGLVREQVIAALFGASAATDAFTAASRLPIAVYDLLVGGMVSAALIPVFSDYVESKEWKELGTIVGTIMALVLVSLLVVVSALVFFAPQVMGVFTYGYGEEVRLLSVLLARVMLPALIFMGIAGVLSALLYSQRRFTLPSLAAAIYNVGIIAGALLLFRIIHVASLVVGVLLGAALQAVLQARALTEVWSHLRVSPWHPGVRRILALYSPVALGLVVSAGAIAIDTNLASRTGEGNLAAMRFATTLVQLPLGLVATAVSYAILPTLARQRRREEGKDDLAGFSVEATPGASQEPLPVYGSVSPAAAGSGELAVEGSLPTPFKKTLAAALKMVIFLVIPATVGLVALRFPIIRLLFQRGAFDSAATGRTAAALLAYSPGMPAAAVDQVLIFAFYALKRPLIPVLVGVLGVGVYLAVGITLMGPLGMPGLALANSAQWIVHALVMLVLLHRILGGLEGLGLMGAAVRALAASTLMGGLLLSLTLVAGPMAQGVGAHVLYVALAVALGASVYAAALWLMKGEEREGVTEAIHRWRGGRRDG